MAKKAEANKKLSRKRSSGKKTSAKKIRLETSFASKPIEITQKPAKPTEAARRGRKGRAKNPAGSGQFGERANQASFITSAIHTLDDLQTAKNEWSARLLMRDGSSSVEASMAMAHANPDENVTGVGIAEKLVEGKSTGVMAVKFFVRRKYPEKHIKRKSLLPKSIDGIPVDVEEVDIFRPLLSPAAATVNPRRRLDPALPGCSIGVRFPGSISGNVGTFGALVQDSVNLYILSNNHVLLPDNSHASLDMPVFQPGPFELDPRSEPIAIVDNTFFLNPADCNHMDFAIAKVPNPGSVSNFIIGIGPPRGAGGAQVDMLVHKFGRTTEYTAGIVRSISFDVRVAFRSGIFTFCNQMIIQGDRGSLFADEGDSGALVLERNSQVAVGLLMGRGTGRDGNSYIVANPLLPILDSLNLQLV